MYENIFEIILKILFLLYMKNCIILLELGNSKFWKWDIIGK